MAHHSCCSFRHPMGGDTTHELQSRALQTGPAPTTSSEIMIASSADASVILMRRSAKQFHSSVIAGSCSLSVA